MSFRKFSSSQLFTGTHMLDDSYVLVTNDKGIVQEIIKKEKAGDDVEHFEGTICPGFVNTHCHLELSHLKSKIPEHTGLVTFVQQVMQQRQAATEEKQAAMQQAATSMYESGIVAVGDICNTADSISVKQNSNIYWHSFLEVTGFVPATAKKRLAEVQELANQFSIFNFQFSIVPHSGYSVSSSLFALLNSLPDNDLLSIHNQETEDENEFFKTKTGSFLNLYKNLGIDISFFQPTGKSSLQNWLPHFTNKQKLLLIHNVVTTKEDVEFLKQTPNGKQQTLCLCPNANLYISNKLPDIDLLISSGINISVGTDSLASNHQLNILEEIKTLKQQFKHLPTEQLLQCATLNGAKALSIETKYGSFETGKQPGIVLIDTNFTFSKRLL